MDKKMFVFISILFSFLVFTNIDNVGAMELIHTAEYQDYFKVYENIGDSKDWYIKKCTYTPSIEGTANKQVDVYYRRNSHILYDENNYDAKAPIEVDELLKDDPNYSDAKMLSEAGCPPGMLSSVVTSSTTSEQIWMELIDERYVRGAEQYCEGSMQPLDETKSNRNIKISLTASPTEGRDPSKDGLYFRKLQDDIDHYDDLGNGGKWEFKNENEYGDSSQNFNFYYMSDIIDFLETGCSNLYVTNRQSGRTNELRMKYTDPIPDIEIRGDWREYWIATPGELKSNTCFTVLNEAFDKQNYYGAQIGLLSDDVNSIIYQLSQSDGVIDACVENSESAECKNAPAEKQITREERDALIEKVEDTRDKIKTLRAEIEASDKNYGDCEISEYLVETTNMTEELDRILSHLEGEEFNKLLIDFENYNKSVVTTEDIDHIKDMLEDIKEETNKIVEVTGATFDIPGTNVEVDCNTLFGAGTPLGDILREVLTWMQILAPIALIILGSMDFGQVVLSGDQEALKKAGSKFMKRCIAAVGLFFVPLMLKIILDTDLLGIESNCIEELTTTEQSGSNSNDESSVNGNVLHTPQ